MRVAGLRYQKGRLLADEFEVPEEAELEIVLNGRLLTRLAYTPGEEAALGLGYLFNNGFFQRLSEVAWRVDPERRRFCAHVEGATPPEVGLKSSACGGGDQFLARGLSRLPEARVLDPELPFRLIRELHRRARRYQKTRGIHAAALFDLSGNLLFHFEDIGRHNALDRLAGAALLEGAKGPFLLAATGRLTLEMAAKAARIGAVLAASRTGASDRAIRLAQAVGLALAAYVRTTGYRVYSAPERFSRSSKVLTLAKTAGPKRASTSDQGR